MFFFFVFLFNFNLSFNIKFIKALILGLLEDFIIFLIYFW